MGKNNAFVMIRVDYFGKENYRNDPAHSKSFYGGSAPRTPHSGPTKWKILDTPLNTGPSLSSLVE